MLMNEENNTNIDNIEANVIVNFIFDYANRIEIASRIKPYHFSNKLNSIIYFHLLKNYESNQNFDYSTLLSYFKTIDIPEKNEIISQLQIFQKQLDYYIIDLNNTLEILEYYYIYNCVVKEVNNWLHTSVSIYDIHKNLNTLHSNIFNIVNSKTSSDLIKINHYSEDFFNKLQNIQNNQKGLLGITTGYKSLNNFIHGFKPGELIILAARPGVGKTALSLNMMLNVAKECKPDEAVVMFSFEMSNDALYQRLIACESRVRIDALSRGLLKSSDEKTLAATNNIIENLNIYLSHNMNLSILDIESKIRQLAKEKTIKLVIIDYLQLITSDVKIANRAIEVASISRRLKLLSLELNIPILAIAQLSRNVEQRKAEDSVPRLSDLRESGAIEQDADIVIFLDPEQKQLQLNNDEQKKLSTQNVNVVIAKNRNGATGTFQLTFDKATGKYLEQINNIGE